MDCYKAVIEQHNDIVNMLLNDNNILEPINLAVNMIINCVSRDGQILLCGNGGSAADSQHIATEFVSRFYLERKAINAEALTVNTSSLTAISNDYDFSDVFARQVEAKGHEGDILIGLSTSGESINVIKALKTAKERGMRTIVFTGQHYNGVSDISDVVISIPSDCTPRIQEMHIMIGHIICEQVERTLFGECG